MGLQTEKFIFEHGREIDSLESFRSCRGLLPQKTTPLVGGKGMPLPPESEEAIHGMGKSSFVRNPGKHPGPPELSMVAGWTFLNRSTFPRTWHEILVEMSSFHPPTPRY